MQFAQMTNYERGYADYKSGLDPIQDFSSSNEADVEYMRGYRQAKENCFWDDVAKMAESDLCG